MRRAGWIWPIISVLLYVAPEDTGSMWRSIRIAQLERRWLFGPTSQDSEQSDRE